MGIDVHDQCGGACILDVSCLNRVHIYIQPACNLASGAVLSVCLSILLEEILSLSLLHSLLIPPSGLFPTCIGNNKNKNKKTKTPSQLFPPPPTHLYVQAEKQQEKRHHHPPPPRAQTNMLNTKTLVLCVLAAASCLAHISMKDPASLGYRGNPYVTAADYDLSFPIKGPQFPCKLFHKDSARGAGRSVETWPAGSTQSFRLVLVLVLFGPCFRWLADWRSLEGAAIHGGGSCQASLSYDNGATFRVIKSWIGGSLSSSSSSRFLDIYTPPPLPSLCTRVRTSL